MKQRSSLPQIAREAGLGGRYRYWTGRSGRRYLFTRVEDGTNFEGALALLAEGEAIRWLGRADTVPPLRPPGQALFVHLLAGDEAERDRIAQDLVPDGVSDAA